VTADRLLRDLYITHTGEVAGVSREMLERELAGGPRSPRPAPVTTEQPAPRADDVEAQRRERRRDHHTHGVRGERELVRMLLHQRQYVEEIGERIGADIFTDSAYRRIFTLLITLGSDAAIEDLARDLDQDATEILQELLADGGGLDYAAETVAGSVKKLLSRDIATQLTELDTLIPLATDEEKDDLIRQKDRLALEMRKLDPTRWKAFSSTRS
jgi:hypothetical protein